MTRERVQNWVILFVCLAVALRAVWQLGGHAGLGPLVTIGSCLTAVACVIAVRWWLAGRKWRRTGYRTRPSGREAWVYEEIDAAGNVRELKLTGELLVGAPSAVYLPSSTEWRDSMPEWARDRRTEIVGRIAGSLSQAGWTYEDGDLGVLSPGGQSQ
jgi:hypothetical protein